ncbi:MAG: SurA N-terminal domain-containing protein [Planctomycetes bacterium]|nr:SurA N-terminal domain-containing protein [Planctomycetota bacterium]
MALPRAAAITLIVVVGCVLLSAAGPAQAGDAPAPEDPNAAASPPPDKPLNLDLSFLWDQGQGEASFVIAKVNDEIVTRHEVLSRVLPELEGLARSYPEDQFQRKARERWVRTVLEIVEEKLMLQQAKIDEITVTEAEVDKSLNEEIKKAGGQTKFEQNLSHLGTTTTKYREKVKRELTVREVILRRIGAKGVLSMDSRMPKDIYVPPGDIRAYYDSHKKDYYIEEKVQPRQIILRYRDSESRAAAEEEARSCLRLLGSGVDFGLLAHWISTVRADQDGLCDEAGRGTYPDSIEQVLFALKPGEVSPLLEHAETMTFRIMKVESKTVAQQKTLEEVQEEIKKALQNHKINENVEDVKRELKKNAFLWPPELKGKPR